VVDATRQIIEPNLPKEAANSVWLIVSWAWVGIPLAWGVWQTVIKSLPLFESFMSHIGK
jgi:hypothetical protein